MSSIRHYNKISKIVLLLVLITKPKEILVCNEMQCVFIM